MIMKSNYQSTPCDNTVNTVQYWLSNWALQLTRFFCIIQLIYNENRTEPTVFFKTERKQKPNPRFFSKLNRNRTELEKSIPHIPIQKWHGRTRSRRLADLRCCWEAASETEAEIDQVLQRLTLQATMHHNAELVRDSLGHVEPVHFSFFYGKLISLGSM